MARRIYAHDLARNLLLGPDYQGVIGFQPGAGEGELKHDQIQIIFPFKFANDDTSTLKAVFEELSTGVYLPRSSATQGLTKKGESDESNKV